jgi:hypothetical protein
VMETSHNHEDGLSPAAKAAVAALRAEDDMPADARARVWDRLAAGAAREDMSVRTGRWRAGLVIGLAVAAGVVIAVAGVRRAAVAGRGRHGRRRRSTAGSRRGRSWPRARGRGRSWVVKEEVAPSWRRRSSRRRWRGVSMNLRTGPRGQVASARMGAPVSRWSVGSRRWGARRRCCSRRRRRWPGRGRPRRSMRLAAYDREFGAGGVLRPEHDALRAVALCAAGRADEGRAAADALPARARGVGPGGAGPGGLRGGAVKKIFAARHRSGASRTTTGNLT